MSKKISNSQVAENGSSIINSKNSTNISVKKIRTETVIISFIVGTIASILASFLYEHWIK